MKSNRFKRLLSMVLAAAMALSITACGGKEKPDPAGASDVTDGVKESLTIGVTALWPTLCPFQGANNQWGPFVRTIYDRLGIFQDGECVKQAAESWEVAEDGVTWTIKIRDNIVDTAGNKIIADDVVWYIQESIARGLKPQFNKVASVEKVDDLTIQVVMKTDVVGSFELMISSVYMVSKAAFEASSDEFATTVVSSGPYKVLEFVPGSHLTLEKRSDYWNGVSDDSTMQCNVEHLTYNIITETSQQQIALEGGTVDAFENVASSLISNFENNPNFGVISAPQMNGIQMYFSGDASRPTAEDENLRKAICHAIDVDGIINTVYEGKAEAMHDPTSRSQLGYLEKWNEEEYFSYDVEKAKEYLSKSGYNGEELSIMSMGNGTYPRLGQTIQSYLMAVGINCKLNLLDQALFSASLFDGSQYDMILVQAGGPTITNLWGNRFDMNAYAGGDATARRDETLTNMIYNAWTQAGFTEENIDEVHTYLKDHCYAYGLIVPTISCVYRTDSGMVNAPVSNNGAADFVAAQFQ